MIRVNKSNNDGVKYNMYKRSFSPYYCKIAGTKKNVRNLRSKGMVVGHSRHFQAVSPVQKNILDYHSLNEHVDRIVNRITKRVF